MLNEKCHYKITLCYVLIKLHNLYTNNITILLSI